ncbi:hypothetical protein T440DRAFT_13916 [Plenodomus tracheiphilus IPT5]|uniref:Uncharacterized protein n=1 Tax=Plenodomus tracheiphilus IPT5 TaxID=1408161 RepID=A0A6A7BQA7_9PLEO|nr:hypothetical protein T440DRAFT_13916 [Plenodomus tracheiphilus IPT5]
MVLGWLHRAGDIASTWHYAGVPRLCCPGVYWRYERSNLCPPLGRLLTGIRMIPWWLGGLCFGLKFIGIGTSVFMVVSTVSSWTSGLLLFMRLRRR